MRDSLYVMIDLALPSFGSVLVHLFREKDGSDEMVELGTGTGFFVKGGEGIFLVTNWHVVTGRDPVTGDPVGNCAASPSFIEVDLHNPDDLRAPATHRYPLYDKDGPIWFTHPKLGNAVDVVALKVGIGGNWARFSDRVVQIEPYSLTVDIPMRFEPTSEVSIIGYPYGRRSTGSLGIWTRGTIASEPDLDFDDQPIVLIDAASREGQSGSPVIAFRSTHSLVHYSNGGSSILDQPVWELLGVYSGRISKESDLGKVWKRSVIQQIVAGQARDSFEFF